MNYSAQAPARRLATRIALVGALSAVSLGIVAAPAFATGTHAGSCNFGGNVKWVEECPDAP